jgi:hypothetical protein
VRAAVSWTAPRCQVAQPPSALTQHLQGNKLSQSTFIAALYPKATPFERMQWTVLNSAISLLGYWTAAFFVDKPWYGRRRMQVRVDTGAETAPRGWRGGCVPLRIRAKSLGALRRQRERTQACVTPGVEGKKWLGPRPLDHPSPWRSATSNRPSGAGGSRLSLVGSASPRPGSSLPNQPAEIVFASVLASPTTPTPPHPSPSGS